MSASVKDIREKARTLGRQEMKAWLEDAAGKKITWKSFESALRAALPRESHYQEEILHFLRSIPGAFAWKAAAGPYARVGIPDICCVIDGRFFGFEVKRPIIGKATAIQEETIRKIQAAGGTAAIVSTKEQAEEVIGAWREARTPPGSTGPTASAS